MLAYTYIEKGKFALVEKPKPTIIESTDAIVRVTMSSICSSDLHIKHEVYLVRFLVLPLDTKWWEWLKRLARMSPM